MPSLKCYEFQPTAAIARLVVYAALLLALLSSATQAGVIKGTFEGTAYNSRLGAEAPDGGTNFDGEIVTGSFYFDPYNQTHEGDIPTPGSPILRYGYIRPGSLELVFNAAGRSVSFGLDGGSMEYQVQGRQYVHFFAGIDPYSNALLHLSGPFFHDANVESIHAAPVDLNDSWAGFFAGRSFGASVQITRVTFDGESTAVPEPSTLALIIGSVLAAGLASIRSKPWPSLV